MKNRELRNYQPLFPMHLQFFAEDAPKGTDDSTPPDESGAETGNEGNEGNEKPTKSYEDALAEIAAAQAEAKKAKAERDAALKKAGDATKQLRAKMSEAELEAEQKAQEDEEKQAYVKELEDYKKKNEAIKRYVLQGMTSELAEKAAQAELENDMDSLADIQKQHTNALIKAKEAEWKASRPRVNIGDGDDSSMTKEEILAIKDTEQRQRAIAAHLDLFSNKN